MPNQAVLKLCERCDQVSVLRSTSRELRCYQRLAGTECGSRHVRPLSIAEFNMLRALEKATYEERLGDLEARMERLERASARR